MKTLRDGWALFNVFTGHSSWSQPWPTHGTLSSYIIVSSLCSFHQHLHITHYTTVWYDFAATHDDISWMWTLHIGVLTYWCLNVDMSRRYVELYTNTCWPSERTPCLLSRCERRGPLEQSVPGPGNWTLALVAVAACVKSVFMCLLPLMCSDHFISLTLSLAWLYHPTVRKVVVG